MVNSLSEVAFLNDQTILNNLKSELPQYIAKAAETSPEVDVMSGGLNIQMNYHIGQLLQRWLLLFSLYQVLLKGYSQF